MRVLVAMSGGVDSSVAAAMLVEAGHDVVGATLKLWGGPSDSGCCSVSDVDDARRVAQILGVDHHVFSFTDEFERDVVAPYVAGHAAGRSPNPCIECNRSIKFDLLVARARRLGFDAVATGHHARVRRRRGGVDLVRGVDVAKDQSYVLAHTPAAVLERLLLPVGECTKDEVRLRARALELRTWDKPDSQDVCFIEARTGRGAFLADRTELTEAAIVDRTSGATLGTAPAAELLTVGQRRHIPRGPDGTRRYVAAVDVRARRVEVDALEAVMTSRVALDPATLSFTHPRVARAHLFAQCSAHGTPAPARLVGDALELATPIRPVAPGQTVALYHGSRPDVVAGAAIVA